MEKDWRKYIGFTKSEKRVIIFLIIVLTFGFLIKLYVEVLSKPELPPYDFTEFDEKYKKASETYNKLLSGDTVITDSPGNRVDSLKNEKLKDFEKVLSVNINTADKTELMKLPGIGAKTASDIVIFRDKNGNFAKIEDIMKIKGIKKSKFEKLKDNIRIKD